MPRNKMGGELRDRHPSLEGSPPLTCKGVEASGVPWLEEASRPGLGP